MIKWSHYKLPLRKWYWKTIYTFIAFLLFFISARGSVNPHIVYSFIRDAEITDNNLLNSSVTNAIVALYTAYQDRKHLSTLTSIEIEEALDSFKKIYPNIEVSQDNLKEKLYKKTDSSIFSQNPHTVFVLMEGWGRHLLKFHNKEKLNFLGRLEQHLEEDFFFKNFF